MRSINQLEAATVLGRTFELSVFLAVRREEYIGKELLTRIARVLWPVLDVVPHARLQPFHKLQRRRAELLDNLIPLINVIWTGKKDGTANHLPKYASHRPNIHYKKQQQTHLNSIQCQFTIKTKNLTKKMNKDKKCTIKQAINQSTTIKRYEIKIYNK